MRQNEEERLRNLIIIENSFFKEGVSLIAGVDEVGRGPLAGPVVAAAVIFNPAKLIDLSKFTGLNDSKKVNEKNRGKLFPVITNEALAFSFGIVDEKKIDEINILKASLLAMKNAVLSLKILPELVLIDGPYKLEITHRQLPIIDGDAKSFVIAAASIIAKVKRDGIMKEYDKEFPQYGFAVNKGYGTKKHIDAIKEFGRCKIHRKFFGKDF